MAKPRLLLLGTMACLCCSRQIPVKRNADTGTLNAACGWCDFPAWAKEGSEAARIIAARVRPDADPAPAAPAPAPKPPAAPAAAKAADSSRPPPEHAPARKAALSPFHF